MRNHPGDPRGNEAALLRIEQRQIITIALLARIINLEVQEMSDLANITAKVEKTEGAAQSAVILIQALAAEVRANATDPAALSALADRLDATATNLGDAVVANPA